MNLNSKEENIDLVCPNPEIKETPTVFIGKIDLTGETAKILSTPIQRKLYIFGASVKTGEVSLKYGELKSVEFIVLEKNLENGEVIRHHLAQHRTVMYKREEDKTSGESVDMLKKTDIRYLHHLPKWKASEASIPIYNGELFYFASQFFMPDNSTNRQYLTFDTTAFIFVTID